MASRNDDFLVIINVVHFVLSRACYYSRQMAPLYGVHDDFAKP